MLIFHRLPIFAAKLAYSSTNIYCFQYYSFIGELPVDYSTSIDYYIEYRPINYNAFPIQNYSLHSAL